MCSRWLKELVFSSVRIYLIVSFLKIICNYGISISYDIFPPVFTLCNLVLLLLYFTSISAQSLCLINTDTD